MSETSTNAPPPGEAAAEPAEEAASRGLFSRLIGALSPSDPVRAAQQGSTVGEMPGVRNLRKLRVDDVAIPKADIVAIPVNLTLDEVVDVFRRSGFSRLPVYDGTLDSPLFLVTLKDLALNHGFGAASVFDIRALRRDLLFVPPSMPAPVLLQKMQAERIHMALVIDEYGGTDGLVTIEDLLETVVGEIADEHDEHEAASFTREKPGVWTALATTPLDEFEAEIGLSLTDHEDVDEEEVDTLGGLVALLAGHLPARGEVIAHPAGPEFEVIEADPRRIKRLRVRLTPAATET
jgi:magnesium and cobalt transporter